MYSVSVHRLSASLQGIELLKYCCGFCIELNVVLPQMPSDTVSLHLKFSYRLKEVFLKKFLK